MLRTQSVGCLAIIAATSVAQIGCAVPPEAPAPATPSAALAPPPSVASAAPLELAQPAAPPMVSSLDELDARVSLVGEAKEWLDRLRKFVEFDRLQRQEQSARLDAASAEASPQAVFYATSRTPYGANDFSEQRDDSIALREAPLHVGRCTNVKATPAAPAEGAPAALLDSSLSASKAVTIFVHGYNNDFAAACADAVLLARKTEFDGPLLVFSWPVRGGGLAGPLGYLPARATADDWSARQLSILVQTLLDDGKISHVHVLAHSMGSRVALDGLADIGARAHHLAKLGQLVIAAGDFDLTGAVQQLKVVAPMFQRATIYYSQRDDVIATSEIINGFPRLGRGGKPLTDAADAGLVSAVNATDVADRGFGGHGYMFSDQIGKAIGELLVAAPPPSAGAGRTSKAAPQAR